MANKWGNPDTSSFERQNLRYARYDDVQVQVHKLIWPLVERLLAGLSQADIDVSAVKPLDDPRRLGFELPGADPEAVVAIGGAAKFAYDGLHVTFEGTADEAVAIGQLIEASIAQENAYVPPAEPSDPAEVKVEPFAKVVDYDSDDHQDLVLLVQYLVGAEPTGVWSLETQRHLASWQRRHGIKDTGLLDDDTWKHIIPQRQKWLRPGATGHYVTVLQAAMVVRGYLPAQRLNGVWGIDMSRGLRRLQADYGLFPRLRIGNPEWAALFG